MTPTKTPITNQTPATSDPQLTPPTTQEESEAELENLSLQEAVVQTENQLLKYISIILLLHGTYSLYRELIEIFYVFPYIPNIYKSLNFSESFYQGLFSRSLVTAATALLETVYGFILIKKGKHLAHRVHIVSGIGLVIVSFILSQGGQTLQFDGSQLPTPPTIPNLLRQNSLQDALGLFSRP